MSTENLLYVQPLPLFSLVLLLYCSPFELYTVVIPYYWLAALQRLHIPLPLPALLFPFLSSHLSVILIIVLFHFQNPTYIPRKHLWTVTPFVSLKYYCAKNMYIFFSFISAYLCIFIFYFFLPHWFINSLKLRTIF